ncbi:MAG: diguanylate cyclase [Solirubrobacterales bacterium]
MEGLVESRAVVGKVARPLLWAAIAFTAAWTVWSLAGRPGHTGHLFNAWIYDLAIASAAFACLAEAVAAERARAAWAMLGSGLLAWAVANFLSYTSGGYDEALGRLTWVDVFFLAALPCLFAGVALLTRSRPGPFPIAGWFDALAAGLAITALALALSAPSILQYGPESTVDQITNTVYPFVDLLMFGFLAGSLLTRGARGSRAMQLVAVGLLVWTATDAAFAIRLAEGSYRAGVLDALWPLGAVLIAAGAVRGFDLETGPIRDYRSPKGLALISGVVAVGILCAAGLTDVAHIAVFAASAAVLALVLRLIVSSREYDELLSTATDEAVTDALTGLSNRRKLFDDLGRLLSSPEPEERLLALFDLNGFKDYNDAFGHGAGDALLRRLGRNLERAVEGSGRAYRLGGDEFCVLCDPAKRPRAAILHLAHQALTENGEAFSISASGGTVELPDEAVEPEDALRKADARMYADKGGSSRPDRQTAGALLRVLREREPALEIHVQGVAEAAALTAMELGVDAEGIDVVRRAAELHDVGKVAIPDEILHKPGPLDDAEMELMRSHTVVGERIIGSSQAMRPVALLVRSSHERWDGGGYPDGLAGDTIPLGSRIIFVCDAFDAMTSNRPYQPAVPQAVALAELRRNAGGQFDPSVVDAFCRVVNGEGTAQLPDEQRRPPELAAEPPRDLPRG